MNTIRSLLHFDDGELIAGTPFAVWMFLVVVLIWNFVAAVLLLVSGASNGGADLGAAIMYIPVIGILSFLTWYRPAYNG